MVMKSLGTIGVLVFCMTLAAAEPSSPSEAGSAIRGPLPGEFSDPGAPAGPGATRRAAEESDAMATKPEDGASARRKKKSTDSSARVFPGTSSDALDRDKDRAHIDEESRGNRVLVSRPHRSR